MTQKTRSDLAVQFADGERPNGQDFRDVFDSCLNKVSDGLSVDGDQTLVLSRGLRLGNSAANVAGGLRFSGGQVQFNDGTNWQAVGGSSGAFAAPGASPGMTGPVTYAGGNVGIGTFAAATPPTYRFEVNLAANTAVGEQVRFGNAVVCNGAQAFNGFGVFAHRNHATNSNYALRQSPTGAVQLNVPSAQIMSLRQNDNTVLAIAANGKVIIGGLETNLTGSSNQSLQVDGGAFKSGVDNLWSIGSDARLKEDIRDLESGLAELRRVRPVRFRFNGRGGQKAGQPGIGVLGQEIEQIFPETVEKVPATGIGTDEIDDMRIFNGSALTYVLINAVKQLADKVDELERALAARREH
jgi:hypothetical protein